MFKKGSKYIIRLKTKSEDGTERLTTITATIKNIIGSYYIYEDKFGAEQGFELNDLLKNIKNHREVEK